MIHSSAAIYFLKRFASALISVLCILGTVFGALVAQGVGYVPVVCDPMPCEALEGKRNMIIASAMNLAIIGGAGQIFQIIAEKTTNWENHRTVRPYARSDAIQCAAERARAAAAAEGPLIIALDAAGCGSRQRLG